MPNPINPRSPVQEPELDFNKIVQVLIRRRRTLRAFTGFFLLLALLYGYL